MSARLSFLSLIFADKKMSNSDDDFQDLPDPPYTPMPSLKNATKQKFKPPISKKPDIVKKPYFELKNNELISLKVNDDWFLNFYIVIPYFRLLDLRKLN